MSTLLLWTAGEQARDAVITSTAAEVITEKGSCQSIECGSVSKRINARTSLCVCDDGQSSRITESREDGQLQDAKNM